MTTAIDCPNLVSDLNYDCKVDLMDFAIMAEHWLDTTANNANGCTITADRFIKGSYILHEMSGMGLLKTHGTPDYIDTMDDLFAWVTNHAVTTLDSNYYSCTSDPSNPGSIRMAVDTYSYGQITKTLGAPMDISGSNISIRYYVPVGSGATSYEKIESIRLYLIDTNSYHRRWDIFLGTAACAVPGWHTWTGTLSEYTSKSGTDLDTAAVTVIKFRIDTVDNEEVSPEVVFDSIVFTPKLSKGLVQFIFTGGNVSQIPAAAYLASKGIPGTFMICGSLAGHKHPPGIGEWRMTAAEARALQSAGHLIASNGWARTHIATDTIAAVREDLMRNQEWLIENGLGAGARIHFQHYKGWIADGYAVLGDLTDMVYRAGNTDVASTIKPTRPLYIPSRQFISGYQDSQSAYTDAIDNAIANGSIATHYFNNVGGGEHLTWAEFVAVVDDVATHRDNGDIVVVTPLNILHNNWTD